MTDVAIGEQDGRDPILHEENLGGLLLGRSIFKVTDNTNTDDAEVRAWKTDMYGHLVLERPAPVASIVLFVRNFEGEK
jgi:hypothetical protein